MCYLTLGQNHAAQTIGLVGGLGRVKALPVLNLPVPDAAGTTAQDKLLQQALASVLSAGIHSPHRWAITPVHSLTQAHTVCAVYELKLKGLKLTLNLSYWLCTYAESLVDQDIVKFRLNMLHICPRIIATTVPLSNQDPSLPGLLAILHPEQREAQLLSTFWSTCLCSPAHCTAWPQFLCCLIS